MSSHGYGISSFVTEITPVRRTAFERLHGLRKADLQVVQSVMLCCGFGAVPALRSPWVCKGL